MQGQNFLSLLSFNNDNGNKSVTLNTNVVQKGDNQNNRDQDLFNFAITYLLYLVHVFNLNRCHTSSLNELCGLRYNIERFANDIKKMNLDVCDDTKQVITTCTEGAKAIYADVILKLDANEYVKNNKVQFPIITENLSLQDILFNADKEVKSYLKLEKYKDVYNGYYDYVIRALEIEKNKRDIPQINQM